MISESLKQYKAVLLSGCAVLGAAHIGFLMSLQNANRLRFLRVLTGTSIGSIIGFLFLLNVPLTEIFEAFGNKSMLSMLTPVQSRNEVAEGLGLAYTDYIIAHLVDIISLKNIDPQMTFSELSDWMVTHHPRKQKIEFVISVGKCVGTPVYFKPKYFSSATTPHIKVLDAIRSSISIPLLFTTASLRRNGFRYCDGALTDNLPFAYVHQKYNILYEDMIAHSPTTQSRAAIQNAISEVTVMSNMVVYATAIMEYMFNELNQARGITDRTVFTELVGQTSPLSMLTASKERLLYYLQQGILSTNAFIYCTSATREPSKRKADL